MKPSVMSIHQPNLSTIKMIEAEMRKTQYFRSRNQLFRQLPKQVMYQTLTTILAYLEESNKIVFNKDGSIIWIFADSRKIKKTLKDSKPYTKL
jgi:hypothetical protein